MSNVKPGDLARVVVDPDKQGFLGAMVAVQGTPQPRWNFLIPRGTIYWECQMLESRHVDNQGHTMAGASGVIKAGAFIVCDDRCLRRIDPPADTEQLYSTAPIEGESLKEFEHANSR